MRLIAVLMGGPKNGQTVPLVGQNVPDVVVVPELQMAPPVDLGAPHDGEEIREVTYVYALSRRERGFTSVMHLYEREAGERNMDWAPQQLVRESDEETDNPDPAHKAPQRAWWVLPRRRR